MATSDAIALVALIVALASAGVTWYEQYGRGARLTVVLGRVISLGYAADHGPYVQLTVVFINDGAHQASVVSVRAILRRINRSWSVELPWRSFFASEDIGTPGVDARPHFAFKGWANIVVVPPRQGIEKGVAFVGPGRIEFDEGEYEAKVEGLFGARGRPFHSPMHRFMLSSDQSRFLEESCVADPETRLRKATLSVPIEPLVTR